MISIIIATYNAEGTIRRALKSILQQKNQDIELVVVDGASTDSTVSIVNDFVFPKKTVISEPDKGIYDAYNKGWVNAHGEWIYYLGADDELLPNAFDLLIENSYNADCVYGNVILVDQNKKEILFKSKEAIVLPTAMCCSHQAIIMKRSCIESLGGFDTHFMISADYDLLLRAYVSGCVFQYVNTNVAIFSCCGASSSLSWYSIKELNQIYKKNKVTKYRTMVVAWNIIKRLVRIYVYDPKKHNNIDS